MVSGNRSTIQPSFRGLKRVVRRVLTSADPTLRVRMIWIIHRNIIVGVIRVLPMRLIIHPSGRLP